MSTVKGKAAELAARDYLQSQGFRIVDTNWRTRWCEIDIVAKQKQTMYFVEVKYRTSAEHGSGLEYITPKKLQQMHFAAEFWMAKHNFIGESTLAAIEVAGEDFVVGELVLID